MSGSLSDSYPDWQRKIKLLTASAWKDANVNEAVIEQWLKNFKGSCQSPDIERKHAFHLLQQFIFYGSQEIEECLRALFRDHCFYPIVQELRTRVSDPAEIFQQAKHRLEAHTRFVGVGNPSESGQMLLYRFRTTNDLPEALFPEMSEVRRVFLSGLKFRAVRLLWALGGRLFGPLCNRILLRQGVWDRLDAERHVPYGLNHLVFLDDFCATGEQIEARVGRFVKKLKRAHKDLRVSYYPLFATTRGFNAVGQTKLFDEVRAAVLFDDDYRAFGDNSQYYADSETDVSQEDARCIMEHYGRLINPSHSLGFRDSQLLIGFDHNTPDNTLPVFWEKDGVFQWSPIFPRAKKH